ncbi:lipopolysaccharide transport periplasmic protein LptA [Oligella urethralis]|uniref:lipopolysaccharide transport periplasmic protein LptA n=1 Tax=Oligella urethralis TaxID=90245 RepID=UPI00288C14E9|nr:lipopolysaccharide transport periplasmic protein LptA [Oligella urethralis]
MNTFSALALSLSVLLGSYAYAQTEQAQEPETLVLSDTLNYDDLSKTTQFSGNVILTRGLFRLSSDQLNIVEDAEGFRHGKATMTSSKLVELLEEDLENYELIRAIGSRAEYNGKTEVVTMIGQAVVTRYVCGQPVDTVRGERVVYDSKNKTYAAQGGPQSPEPGRVRSLVQPRSKADRAVEACRSKYQGKPMPSSIQTPDI